MVGPIAVTVKEPEEPDTELPPGADKADPGLYQNLDFYSWLAANDGSQTKH